MLTMMFLMMLFGSPVPEIFVRDDFRAVTRTIDDEQRAAAVTRSMESVNANVERLFGEREVVFEFLANVDDLVGAKQADYEAVLDPLWEKRRETNALYIDQVFEMRSNMTREEWAEAFGASAD